jgi:hypothetical protein
MARMVAVVARLKGSRGLSCSFMVETFRRS